MLIGRIRRPALPDMKECSNKCLENVEIRKRIIVLTETHGQKIHKPNKIINLLLISLSKNFTVLREHKHTEWLRNENVSGLGERK